MFQQIIEQCIENFGAAPRTISLWDRLGYWRIVRPEWLYHHPNDGMETFFLNLKELRRNGRVVWGRFIQANSLLFAPGVDDCPAEVVYSLDESNSILVEELDRIAGSLYALKHTQPDDPELAPIADYLTKEVVRVYGMPVPKSISPRHACRISTVYVVRKQLPSPRRKLSQLLIPIIVAPNPPHVALPLPSRYWPEALIDWWNRSD